MSTKSACQLVCLACLSAGIALLEPFSRNSPNFCFAPGREAEYCDERVCLSVCVCDCLSAIISSELYTSDLRHFIVYVTYGRGSVLFWQRSDMLCTSGFMDDVIFAHKPRLLDVAA